MTEALSEVIRQKPIQKNVCLGNQNPRSIRLNSLITEGLLYLDVGSWPSVKGSVLRSLSKLNTHC